MSLLLLTDDLKLIKENLREEEYNFEQKLQLIIATQDTRFMRECLKDEVLELSDSDKELLINSTQDIFF